MFASLWRLFDFGLVGMFGCYIGWFVGMVVTVTVLVVDCCVVAACRVVVCCLWCVWAVCLMVTFVFMLYLLMFRADGGFALGCRAFEYLTFLVWCYMICCWLLGGAGV